MTTPTPAPPLNGSKTDFSRTYILYYHYRAAAPLTIVFQHPGSFKDAVERAQLFCKKVNYRFIKIRPFIVDLDEWEKRINEEEYITQVNG